MVFVQFHGKKSRITESLCEYTKAMRIFRIEETSAGHAVLPNR